MSLTVYDHKSFGKDRHLGEADVEVRRVFICALIGGVPS